MENFLHMTNFFSTSTAGDAGDKYQVWAQKPMQKMWKCENVFRQKCPLEMYKGDNAPWECMNAALLSQQKQARKLQATLVRNYDSPTDWLTDGGEV